MSKVVCFNSFLNDTGDRWQLNFTDGIKNIGTSSLNIKDVHNMFVDIKQEFDSIECDGSDKYLNSDQGDILKLTTCNFSLHRDGENRIFLMFNNYPVVLLNVFFKPVNSIGSEKEFFKIKRAIWVLKSMFNNALYYKVTQPDPKRRFFNTSITNFNKVNISVFTTLKVFLKNFSLTNLIFNVGNYKGPITINCKNCNDSYFSDTSIIIDTCEVCGCQLTPNSAVITDNDFVEILNPKVYYRNLKHTNSKRKKNGRN